MVFRRGTTMSTGDREPGTIPRTEEERMTEIMEALMRRQEQRFQDVMQARMTIAGAREEGDYSGRGANIWRRSPTAGDLEVASREELAESASANVGAREFRSLKHAARRCIVTLFGETSQIEQVYLRAVRRVPR